jgi:hypothetical protein
MLHVFPFPIVLLRVAALDATGNVVPLSERYLTSTIMVGS